MDLVTTHIWVFWGSCVSLGGPARAQRAVPVSGPAGKPACWLHLVQKSRADALRANRLMRERLGLSGVPSTCHAISRRTGLSHGCIRCSASCSDLPDDGSASPGCV